MKTSESILKISDAIVSAQSQIKGAFKDGKNTFFKNAAGQATAYATLDSVIEAARIPLATNGLAVIQAPIESSEKFYVETRLQHKSGEYYEILTPLLFQKHDMQGFGSAITYAKRYALGSLLNISTDGDDDGNATAQPQNQPVVVARPQTTAPKAPAPQPVIDVPLADYVMTCGNANVKGRKLSEIDNHILEDSVAFFTKGAAPKGHVAVSIGKAQEWLNNGAPTLNTNDEIPF